MKNGVVGAGSYTSYNLKECCPAQVATLPSDAVPFNPTPSAPVTGRLYKVDHWGYVSESDGVASTDDIKKSAL